MDSFCHKTVVRLVSAWLASYLSGRTQVTKYGSEISDKRIVHGGVPQGSKIGPVVFIVHINDLPLVLKQPEVTYSDDTLGIKCSEFGQLERNNFFSTARVFLGRLVPKLFLKKCVILIPLRGTAGYL